MSNKKQRNKKAPSLAEIQQTLAELEALGLIRRTGEIRNGRPVFVATKFWPMKPRESN